MGSEETDITHDQSNDSRAAAESALLNSLLLLLSQDLIIQIFEAGFEPLRNAVPAVRTLQALAALWGL